MMFITVQCEVCGTRQTFRSESTSPAVDIMTQIDNAGWQDGPGAVAVRCSICPAPSCPDCGEEGEKQGHMGCQYPS